MVQTKERPSMRIIIEGIHGINNQLHNSHNVEIEGDGDDGNGKG